MNFLQNVHSADWILNTAVQSITVLFFGWLFVRLFRHKSAPLRSAVVVFCLLILAILPILNISSLSLAPSLFDPAVFVKLKASPVAAKIDSTASFSDPAEAFKFKADAFSERSDDNGRQALQGSSWITIFNIFGIIWMTVSLVFLLHFFRGILSLRRLKKSMKEIDHSHICQILVEAQSVFPRAIHTKVYESNQISSPMALGFFKPYILIPSSSIKKMHLSKIKGILIHELSHIYHLDLLFGVLQRLVTLFNWWNPLVYTLNTALSRAREEISDNHVLLSNDSKEYARCLVELVEQSPFLRRYPVSTAMACSHIPLKERVKLILSKERNMETRLKTTTLGLILCVSFLFLVLVSGCRLSFAGVESADTAPEASTEKAFYPERSQSQEEQPPKKDFARVSIKIMAPKLIKKVDPIYPESAIEKGIEGVVILDATTDEEGQVQDVKILRSVPALDGAAIEAVKQWIYEPMIIEGKPYGFIFTVTCHFKITDRDKSGIVGGVAGGVQGGVQVGIEGGVKGGVISGVSGGVEAEVKGLVLEDTETGIKNATAPQVKIFVDKDLPQLIKKVDPSYPEEALKAGITGKVILKVTIDEEGKVTKAKVIQSIPELDEAALKAIEQWIYEPYIQDGKPKDFQFSITFQFYLK